MTLSHRSPEALLALSSFQADEQERLRQGMHVLAELARGRSGEEGMRRHYLALMALCQRELHEAGTA